MLVQYDCLVNFLVVWLKGRHLFLAMGLYWEIVCLLSDLAPIHIAVNDLWCEWLPLRRIIKWPRHVFLLGFSVLGSHCFSILGLQSSFDICTGWRLLFRSLENWISTFEPPAEAGAASSAPCGDWLAWPQWEPHKHQHVEALSTNDASFPSLAVSVGMHSKVVRP